MAGLNTSFTGIILFRNCEENIGKHEANTAFPDQLSSSVLFLQLTTS